MNTTEGGREVRVCVVSVCVCVLCDVCVLVYVVCVVV